MTDISQIMSWVVTIVGLVGFYFAGQKKWWCWYINIFCQFLWTFYAIVSNQPAFLLSVFIYTILFTRNAIKWTKEHQAKKKQSNIFATLAMADIDEYVKKLEVDKIIKDVRDRKITFNQGLNALGFPTFVTTERHQLIETRLENALKYPQTVFRKAPDRTRINEELVRNWGKDGPSDIR